MEEIILKSIDKKMNVLISFLLKSQNNFDKPEVEIIKMLNDFDLTNEDIGDILYKTPTQISKQLYKAKKRKGGK